MPSSGYLLPEIRTDNRTVCHTLELRHREASLRRRAPVPKDSRMSSVTPSISKLSSSQYRTCGRIVERGSAVHGTR